MDNPFVFREETLESKKDQREGSRVWLGNYGKYDYLIARLSLEIPLCLLPVMMWINSFGFYQSLGGRHNPLSAIGGQCMLSLLLLTSGGALLALIGVKNLALKAVVLGVLFVTFMALKIYLEANMVSYSFK